MSTETLQYNGNRLAFVHRVSSDRSRPAIFFCGGFNSSMQGEKAVELQRHCEQQDYSYTRFDYSGHGSSEGEFVDGDIDTWFQDALAIFDHTTSSNNNYIIGSSMGAWIATLLTENRPSHIQGLMTIAAAPDFTQAILPKLTPEQQKMIAAGNVVEIPSDYDDGSPYLISPNLINNSAKHCLLHREVAIDVPVRMLHGTADADVPDEMSRALLNSLRSNDATLTLIKDGDHRLSSKAHLQAMVAKLNELVATEKRRES